MKTQTTDVRIRIPDDLHYQLKVRAAEERRSMNVMAVLLLESALKEQQPQKKTAGQQA